MLVVRKKKKKHLRLASASLMPSNTFMPGLLARAAQEISEKFVVECQPNHVENCLRTIKSIWSTTTQLRNRKKFLDGMII